MQDTPVTDTQKAKKISVKVVLIALIFILVVLVLSFITKEIVLDNAYSFDKDVFTFFGRFSSPALTAFFSFITFFGSTVFLLPTYLFITAYYFIYKKNTRRSINIGIIALVGTILLFVAKHFFQRQRPFDPLILNVKGFSYPSGHSFSSFTLAGILIYILWKKDISLPLKWTSALTIFIGASLVAASRVYLHVHYASDVIAGLCLCIIWLTVSFYLLRKIFGDGKQAVKEL